MCNIKAVSTALLILPYSILTKVLNIVLNIECILSIMRKDQHYILYCSILKFSKE